MQSLLLIQNESTEVQNTRPNSLVMTARQSELVSHMYISDITSSVGGTGKFNSCDVLCTAGSILMSGCWSNAVAAH